MIESPAVGRFDGAVAVVTGAGNGLGRSHARTLASEGALVVVADVDGEAAASVAREIVADGGRAESRSVDLGDPAAAEGLVDEAAEAFGGVDLLVNNAGISRRSAIVDLEPALLDLHLSVHLGATVATTRAALRAMPERGGGRIVNTVSGHAFDPKADGSAAYAAAKGAIFSFTLAAALEAAPLGVAVNAVAPLAYTAMSEEYLSAVPGAAEALDPAHVSRVLVELLAAPLSVTGRVFRIEGERVGEYRVTLSELVATERMGEVLGA